MRYPYSFFQAAVESYEQRQKRAIINQAIATRGAQVEDFDAFITSIDDRPKEVDHEANLAKLGKR